VYDKNKQRTTFFYIYASWVFGIKSLIPQMVYHGNNVWL